MKPKVRAATATGFGVSVPSNRIVYQGAAAQEAELADLSALGASRIRLDLFLVGRRAEAARDA